MALAHAVADDLERDLRKLGTRKRAEGEKRYLKSDLDFLGVSVWGIRTVMKSFAEQHRDLPREDVVALIEALWAKPVFERRMMAAMLLEEYVAVLEPGDLELIERLIRQSKTWALVDVLSGDVVGEIILRNPKGAARLDAWATDDDFWLRRSALLAQLLPLKHGAGFRRFASYADAMLDEKEFFIRKAIGWVLRETAKRRPDEVYEWLAPRAHRASGVTIREAVKYLDETRKNALMSAYNERKAAS
ncbi:MAG TPA: DNA alkylation repair protein [Actinomycetota bacterium]|jgi:3-methyladenine DNA glycosylase AlkD|nr:DNA alkylation repair protein [Actinomycetota bacterium]